MTGMCMVCGANIPGDKHDPTKHMNVFLALRERYNVEFATKITGMKLEDST